MTAHPHAALMAQYAQDAAETDEPWTRWECRDAYGRSWIGCNCSPFWHVGTMYRRKPEAPAQGDAGHDELHGLRAARIAYASEFPLNAEGEPDVGSIHANIRLLKADALRYRWLRDTSEWEPFADSWLTQHDIYGMGPFEMDDAIDALRAARQKEEQS